MAVRLYPPVILQRQAVWTFWSGLRSDLGGPFSDSPIAQILDPYVMVGRTTTVYSRRDLWYPHTILYLLISLPNALNYSFIKIESSAAYLFASLNTLVLSITFQHLQNYIAYLVPPVYSDLIRSI